MRSSPAFVSVGKVPPAPWTPLSISSRALRNSSAVTRPYFFVRNELSCWSDELSANLPSMPFVLKRCPRENAALAGGFQGGNSPALLLLCNLPVVQRENDVGWRISRSVEDRRRRRAQLKLRTASSAQTPPGPCCAAW
eukprot:scaffold3719_cov247-Pinguiococcus_pyrenoidosus.AAC.20